jgi:hypothetical protein
MSAEERAALFAKCDKVFRLPVLPDTPPLLTTLPGPLNLKLRKANGRKEECETDKMYMMKVLR